MSAIEADGVAQAVAAWSGPLTCEQIAEGLRVSVDSVRRVWRAAIEAGALPCEPRPHFVGRAPLIEADDGDAFDLDPEVCARTNVVGSAKLLAALIEHHGDDDRRRDDDLTMLFVRRAAEHEDKKRSLRKVK